MFDIGVGEALVFVGFLVGVGLRGTSPHPGCGAHAREATLDPSLILRTYVPFLSADPRHRARPLRLRVGIRSVALASPVPLGTAR